MKTVLLSLAVLIIFGLQAVRACTCGYGVDYVPQLQTSYQNADAIIVGKVVSRSKEQYQIRVDQVWKGGVEKEILAVDIYDGTSCGLSLKKGPPRYFFLASTNSDIGGSKGDKYRNTTVPVRIKDKQVFFIRPCVPIVEASNWDRYRNEYDKSGFWLTLGKGKEPLSAVVNNR